MTLESVLFSKPARLKFRPLEADMPASRCLRPAFLCFIFPEAVILNLFLAPLWFLSLGINFSDGEP